MHTHVVHALNVHRMDRICRVGPKHVQLRTEFTHARRHDDRARAVSLHSTVWFTVCCRHAARLNLNHRVIAHYLLDARVGRTREARNITCSEDWLLYCNGSLHRNPGMRRPHPAWQQYRQPGRARSDSRCVSLQAVVHRFGQTLTIFKSKVRHKIRSSPLVVTHDRLKV